VLLSGSMLTDPLFSMALKGGQHEKMGKPGGRQSFLTMQRGEQPTQQWGSSSSEEKEELPCTADIKSGELICRTMVWTPTPHVVWEARKQNTKSPLQAQKV